MVKERSGLNSWIRVGERRENGNNNESNGSDREYHEFDGVSDSDGWEYEGDDVRQVIDFFKRYSNSYELLDSMTPEEQHAFQAWARGDLMNSMQWMDWNRIPPYMKRVIRNIAEKLDESRLDRGMVIARLGSGELLGIGSMARNLGELQALKGQILTSKGMMSWGAAKEGLRIPGGWQDKNIEYKLRIPAGTKGSGMWIGDRRVHTYWGSAQREYITNRDISVRVGDSYYDRHRGKYIVELDYVGRQKHPW